VTKAHNKPIKRPRKGSNKKSKRLLKCALVWRTGLSGVPPDSVRCTREPDSKLATFGNSGGRSAIIHRIVRCSTGLSGVPLEQRLNRANGRLQRAVNALQCAQKSEQSQKAHRAVNSDCPVHHRTIRWPRSQKIQRSEPNNRVTWLAHRTVRCVMRQQPPPNG
jgi:putative component of membrane protein insertase Oxa1/YidC/SpoIIIJ protein YidD